MNIENTLGVMRFPDNILDSDIRAYLHENSVHYGYNYDALCSLYIGLLASLIGNKATITTLDSWTQYPTIWLSIVGEKGANKSAPIDLIFSRLVENEIKDRKDKSKYIKDIEEKLKGNISDDERRTLTADLTELKSNRLFIDDATIEALTRILEINDRGITYIDDELSRLFKSLKRYNSDNLGFWLKSFDGKGKINDRVTSGETIISNTAVNIIGAIQPELLTNASSEDGNYESGFIDRFLVCNIDFVATKYSKERINPDLVNRFNYKIDSVKVLIEHKYKINPEALKLRMSNQLVSKFLDYINELEHMKVNSDFPMMQGIYSKMQKYYARFILILSAQNDFQLDDYLLDHAKQLCEFFINQSEKLYINREVITESKKLTKFAKNKKEAILSLYNSDMNLSQIEIAKMTGYSRQTVAKYIKELEVEKSF